ncbi:MAG: tetratricopeptide repeat protein [Deltaproteobacteria bacterium]|nr:tetratricopeptide repeat protein [Deltaproteobacteria bacterium]
MAQRGKHTLPPPNAGALREDLNRAEVASKETGVDQVVASLVDELAAIHTDEEATVSVAKAGSQTTAPLAQAAEDAIRNERLARQINRLKAEVSASSSRRRAALLLHELGRLYETRLNQPDTAINYYRASLEQHPALGVNARALVRLLLRKDDYAQSVEALTAELQAAPTAASRVAVLTWRALIRIHKLGDVANGRADLQAALEIDADDPIALDALIDIHTQTGAHERAEELLRRRLRAFEDPSLRSVIACEIGRLQERRGAPMDQVQATYRRAHSFEPSNPHALRSLLRLARSRDDHPAAANICQRLAETEPPPMAAALLWEAASIASSQLRNDDIARESLSRAAGIAPDDQALQHDLSALYERQHAWSDLAALLERQEASTSDPRSGAVFAYNLGRVRWERLHDGPGAVAALKDSVRMAPRHLPARSMLGRLCARREAHSDLLTLFAEEMEIFEDPGRRAATAFRMGDIHEQKLDDPQQALENYQLALTIVPSYRPAMRGVSRVFLALERLEDLVATFEQELTLVSDHEDQIRLLERIAGLWDHRLHNSTAAIDAYERALALDPGHPGALHALQRIYESGDRLDDLVKVLRAEAQYTHDPWRRITLLQETASIQENKLASKEDGLATYLELLNDAPDFQPALMAAGRLLKDAGEHSALAQLHRRELATISDPQHKSWLLGKVGRLLEESLGRGADAAEAYEHAAALADEGKATPAIDQALRIYGRLGDHEGTVRLLSRSPVPDAPISRALHHRRLATSLLHSKQPESAIDHLKQALSSYEDADLAREELLLLYRERGDTRNVVGLRLWEVDRANSDEQVIAACYDAALTLASGDRDLDRGVRFLEHIIERDSKDIVAIRLLTSLTARLNRWEGLASALDLEQEQVEDQDYRAACELLVAAIHERRLNDLPSAAQSAVSVLERSPMHPEALTTLERHARASAQPEALLQVLGRRVRTAQTAAEQAADLCAMAAIHARRNEYGRAIEYYRMAAETNASYLPAARGWRAAAEQEGDALELALALEYEATVTRVLSHATATLQLAAEVWLQRADHPRKGIAAYRRVLELDPLNTKALDALSQLYVEKKEYRQLIELLEHQAAYSDDPARKRDFLARVADIQRSRLDDLLSARRTINRAIEIAPYDPNLLSTLAELCRVSEDWDAFAKVNRRLVRLIDDEVLLKALHFELGAIYEDRLNAPDKATDEYRRVLSIDSQHLGAMRKLGNRLFEDRQWTEAAELYQALIRRDEDRRRVRGYHLRLSRIFAAGFKESKPAIDSCRRALALDPGDLEATNQMADLLQQIKDLRRLHAHLESSLTVHRARLERDPFCVPSYHALLAVFERRKSTDHEYIVRQVLDGIHAGTDHDRALLKQMETLSNRSPKRALTREELERILVHPSERGPIFQLLTHADPALRKVFGRAPKPQQTQGKLSARSHPELAAMVDRICNAVGVTRFDAYLIAEGSDQPRLEDSATPSFLLGEVAVEDEAEQRFLIARLATRLRLRHLLPTRLGAATWGSAMRFLLSLTCTSYSAPTQSPEDEATQVQLQRALSKRARRLLEPPALELADQTFSPQRWLDIMQQSEDRVALAITGDVRAAIKVLKQEEAYNLRPTNSSVEDLSAAAGPRLRHLLAFAVSEEHLTLRERIGLALPPDR